MPALMWSVTWQWSNHVPGNWGRIFSVWIGRWCKNIWVAFFLFIGRTIKYLWLKNLSKKLNLPGRWLEIAQTRQSDADHHWPGGDRKFIFVPYYDSACESCFKYLIFSTVSMPVHRMDVHISAHSHQVPIHFITNFHVQTIQIVVHLSIDGCIHRNGHTFGIS